MSKSEKDALREEFPWLTDVDLGAAVGRCQQKRAATSGARYRLPPEPGDGSEDSGDESCDGALGVVDVMAELRRAVDEFADHGDIDGVHYYTRLLKGHWTMEHHGVWSDSIGAFARAHVRRGFLASYVGPKQKSFAHAKYDGAYNSQMLAREWVRKLDYYCTVYFERGEAPDLDFASPELVCGEDNASIEWACTIDLDSGVFDAIREVRHYVPAPRV